MPNRFLTSDEVLVEITIPTLRAAFLAANAYFAENPNQCEFTAPNPQADCLPIVIKRDGDRVAVLEQLSTMESEARERIKRNQT